MLEQDQGSENKLNITMRELPEWKKIENKIIKMWGDNDQRRIRKNLKTNKAELRSECSNERSFQIIQNFDSELEPNSE